MVVLVVSGALLLLLSRGGLHGSRPGNRWPFRAALVLAATAVGAGICSTLVSWAVGRMRWNTWTDGTPLREEISLTVTLLALPLILVIAAILLVLGKVRGRSLRNR